MVKEILEYLFSLELYTIIDFHQDIAHEVYGGNGFHEWILPIDNLYALPIKSDRNYQSHCTLIEADKKTNELIVES